MMVWPFFAGAETQCPFCWGAQHLQQTHGGKIDTATYPLCSYQPGGRLSGVLSIFFLVRAMQTQIESGVL
jgi:hypothetical protein